MPPSPLQILSTYRRRVWPLIEASLLEPDYPSIFTIPRGFKHLHSLHRDMVKDYPYRPSKYLRPTLVLLAYQALTGNKPTPAALMTAAAMQLSEEWILLYDDIQDDSVKRRGLPTLHRLYSKELAINAGITLHNTTYHLLYQALEKLPSPTARQLADEFHRLITRTAVGQSIEILKNQKNQLSLTTSDWYFIADSKASYYTIAGPLRLGAILASATPTQLDHLTQFGQLLGRVFQLTDDILDLTSTFDGKKQQYNDLYESKPTLIIAHLYRHLTRTNRQHLTAIFNKSRSQKTTTDVTWILKQLQTASSLTYALQLNQKLARQTQKYFATHLTFLKHQPYRDYLLALTNFILTRSH